uniref:Uncharacterized protein n=1 Tax=Brassica campestris TaxID=3711 RepID=A0A3P6B684_BRACM|nr:unnamed protein product [Brassica rapa]
MLRIIMFFTRFLRRAGLVLRTVSIMELLSLKKSGLRRMTRLMRLMQSMFLQISSWFQLVWEVIIIYGRMVGLTSLS